MLAQHLQTNRQCAGFTTHNELDTHLNVSLRVGNNSFVNVNIK